MRHGWVLVTLLALAGCRKADAVPDDEPPKKPKKSKHAAGYPIRAKLRWTDVTEVDGKTTKEAWLEDWVQREDVSPPEWDVTSGPVDKPEDRTTTHWKRTPDGLVYDSFKIGTAIQTIKPPKLELPSEPKVGFTWSQDHVTGNKANTRKCTIEAYDECGGGITLACTTTREDGLVSSVKNHYCAGTGWVGYQGKITRNGTVTTNHSEDVVDAK